MTRATNPLQPISTAAGVLLLFVLASGGLAIAPRQAWGEAPSKEYQIKAACLLNFVQFIDWPAGTFSRPETPITIGVLGDDPFGNVLEHTFQDESVGGRGLVVKRSSQLEELKTCHVLFVPKAEKHRLGEILASLSRTSVVTVGEVDQFAQQGGVINFYVEAGKIRFEVNAETAQVRGIKIGSQLLKRARIVGSDPRKGRE